MAQKTRTRETKQRRVVFEAVRKTPSHPTADSIFEQVREEMPKISLGTVYRNLSVLRNEGLVREVYGTDRRAHYEANTTPHAHFMCSACGEIWDVEGLPEMSFDWRTLKDLVGCEIHEQAIEFRGVCPTCQRKTRN